MSEMQSKDWNFQNWQTTWLIVVGCWWPIFAFPDFTFKVLLLLLELAENWYYQVASVIAPKVVAYNQQSSTSVVQVAFLVGKKLKCSIKPLGSSWMSVCTVLCIGMAFHPGCIPTSQDRLWILFDPDQEMPTEDKQMNNWVRAHWHLTFVYKKKKKRSYKHATNTTVSLLAWITGLYFTLLLMQI